MKIYSFCNNDCNHETNYFISHTNFKKQSMKNRGPASFHFSSNSIIMALNNMLQKNAPNLRTINHYNVLVEKVNDYSGARKVCKKYLIIWTYNCSLVLVIIRQNKCYRTNSLRFERSEITRMLTR